MDLIGIIILNANSLMLLIILHVQAVRHTEQTSLQNKLFLFVVRATMFLLVVDTFSRFDGNPGTVFPVLNHTGNFLIFLFSPVLASCWLLYAHFQVHHDEKRTIRLLYPLSAVFTANAIMTVLTQFFGWYYSINAGNIYQRGPLFWVTVSITLALVVATYVLLFANRKGMERKYFQTLVFFTVLPIVCIVLQTIYYTVPLLLGSMALSLLIVYFNIHNGSIYVDYLTGINNRKKLELFLKEKISASTDKGTFSAILFDMNNFKAINDTYGHAVGDEALEAAAKLLKSCLRHNDFIARFGGDEFYAILDISQQSELETAVERIRACLEKYNDSCNRPYAISFSMGYAVYDPLTQMKADDFFRRIDMLMYEDKRADKTKPNA